MGAIQSTDRHDAVFQNTAYFSEGHFLELQRIMREKEVRKGITLFFEGDPADRLYFLKKGAVKLTKTADGAKELLLHCFRSGDLFGEFEGLDVRKCSFQAKAADDSIVGVIHQRDLQVLLSQNEDLCMEFVKWMAHLQRFTQYKLRDLLFYGKTGALASTLIRMVNTYGVAEKDCIRFSVHFTNSELASMIGATRETVNRMLQELKKQKVIDYKRGTITVRKLEVLQQLCCCEKCPVEICRL